MYGRSRAAVVVAKKIVTKKWNGKTREQNN
jgi:hypothetical protein